MARALRVYNGSLFLSGGSRGAANILVAAPTQKEALDLIVEIAGGLSMTSFRQFFRPCWPPSAEAVLGYPKEPGLWLELNNRYFKHVGSARK